MHWLLKDFQSVNGTETKLGPVLAQVQQRIHADKVYVNMH